MLVSTFGIAIGEVERRFYKGVDTGERYVRLKPRAHTQVPDFVTVGGCKILIRVLSSEEVCPPYTLQSQVRYELLYMKHLPAFVCTQRPYYILFTHTLDCCRTMGKKLFQEQNHSHFYFRLQLSLLRAFKRGL